MPIIRLISQEKEQFEVDLAVATMSTTLKTMLDALGYQEDMAPIPMPKINSAMMKLFIEWSTHHKDDPPQTEDEVEEEHPRSDNIDQWDQDFLQPLDTCDLFELIMCANYLEVKGLLEASSKTVANMLKGKTPAEIREVLNVPEPSEIPTDKVVDNPKKETDKVVVDNPRIETDKVVVDNPRIEEEEKMIP